MNPNKVNSSAGAANKKHRQEHSPIGARETLLSKRSAKNFFALVVCQLAALFCLAGPSFALTIDSVVPSKGKVTVNWSGGTAPYQLEKSTDLKTWEPVDTETSATSLASIQTSPNAFYRVRNGSTGGGASGGNKTDTTAPSVPTGVSAANNSCSQVTVSWTASADSGRNATGVKGYYVYRDGIFLRAVLAPATLTSDVGLTASTTYSYTVRAYDGATNFSGYSTAVTTTTPVCADNTPPSVPSGVAAVSSSCSQIDITWSPSTDNTGGSGLQSYSVYRNNAFWKQVLAPATSVSDTGLAAGTTFNYAVMAIDKVGNQSVLSPASTAITPACGDTTAPSVPNGLIVTATSCSQINLSWAASTDNSGGTGVGSYYIYRDGNYLKAVVGGTSTSDAGLAASTGHSYAVTAVDNAGNQSAKCAAVSATTPACADTIAPTVPIGVTATAASTNQINLSWSPSLDNPGGTGLQGYYVYRNGSYAGYASTPSYSSTGLGSGIQYCFTVTALDNSGNQSGFSVQACAATQTPACTYSLSSFSASASASGSSSTVTVSTGNGCSWTPTSNAGWLTFTPASATGIGTLTWTAAANTSTSSRSGTITVQGQSFTVTQAGAACTYTLSAPSASVVATGGSGSVNVTAGAGCTWSASSSDTTWLMITGASGNGSGSVSYSVAANSGTASRTGTLTIGGQVFTVTQSGAACTYTLSSASTSASASGSSSTVTVNAGNGCTWTPASNAGWLTCTPATGTGAGTMTWTAAANTSTSSRSGTITVQGQTFTVTQAGAACTYTLSAPSASVVATGGSGSVNVTAGAGCTWSANSSDTTWLTITGASGNGSGSVSYSVAANSGTTSRTGTLTIGGQVFTVSQAGAACTYTLSSASASALASGTTSSVTVNAGTGCSWTPTSNAGWLTCTPVSGTGTGTLTWTAAANTGTASRTGTITVQGQSFTVTQPGVTCTFTLSSSSISIASIATVGSVNVNASSSSCGWTAVSGASWLTITAGFTGSGNGAVAYSVVANLLSSSRTGTLTIAGQTFNVTQAGVVGDTTPPTVSLTSPTSGSTVSGTVSIVASASDNVGVTRVDFYCDGTMLLGSVTSAPFTYACDTTRIANGSRTFHCQAFDAAGNSTSTPMIPVTVNNTVQSSGPWAKRFGGTGNDYGSAVAVDASGNILMAGYFQGTVDLGGGPLVSAGGYDICVAKYSASGVHVWSKRFGGTALYDTATSMALDNSGNIFIGLHDANFSGAGIMKLSPQGDLLWTKGPSSGVSSVAVDSQGNVVVTGTLNGLIDFGDGTSLQSAMGSGDAFLAKYSPTGTCIWAKRFANSGDNEYGTAVAVDRRINPLTGQAYDTILLAGYSDYDINLGGSTFLNGSSGPFGFLGKFTPAGDHLWSRSVGLKTSSDNALAGTTIQTMSVDSNGDVVYGGGFNYKTDFGAGAVLSTAMSQVGYVAKCSGSDGHYLWGQPITGDRGCWPTGIAVDSQNNVFLTGNFYTTFNFGAQTLTSASAGVQDCFVAKYSGAGAPVWARGFGGTGGDGGCAAAVDSSGTAIVSGYFQDVVSLSGQTLTSAGALDGFLMRLNP